ncbi:olfactory receptor 1500-like [Pygocentrus nattereri]|uniref:olfactory receptor 1500-like n=1 Tax=Pygocentrus nattereri TaxID=42514 RepID=UPI00081474B3|nr:olfactory receptor 1500-like [Pygocentrus nattereri]
MSQKNETTFITEFFIMGFPGLRPEYYSLIGAIFFSIYVIIIMGNSIFIVLFVTETSLHKPMYIIMLNLAVSDVGFCTVALPKLISRYWFNNGSISFQLCLMQRQFIHYFGTLNSLNMMIMAIDRYLAICLPLRYPVYMTTRTMKFVIGFIWVSAMIFPGISTSLTAKMPFCGPNLIMNCFCDTVSMNSLACADVSSQNYISTSLATVVLLLPFSFIIFSYISIVVAVVKIANIQGRQKMFSTCATQLGIISIYYIPRFFVYVTPYIPNLKLNIDQKISLTVFYTLSPALVNPLIYCFRTKEIRQLLLKWCTRKKTFSHNINVVSVSK